ncbi:MAG: glucose 1-dehydrogenase [Chloroflexi bacterium]|nr:glucose 1-dehydrogenase [Chloroflexota bacterium]
MDKIPNNKWLFDVTDRVALITGASGSLGQAAARGLARAGAKVMLTGRDESKLKPLLAEIQAAGCHAAYVAGRPDDLADMQHIVAATVEQFGGIDILLTAAGMNKPKPIVEQPLEDWQAIMDANLKATYIACQQVGKVMVAQGRGGKVILISSTRGKLGFPNYSAYCPSKGAVDSLTQSLAWEWGGHKINVNAIAPTVFRSALTQWIFADPNATTRFLTRIPLGRLEEPEDLIGAVIFLSSHASDFVTGTILYVDGGYTAG